MQKDKSTPLNQKTILQNLWLFLHYTSASQYSIDANQTTALYHSLTAHNVVATSSSSNWLSMNCWAGYERRWFSTQRHKHVVTMVPPVTFTAGKLASGEWSASEAARCSAHFTIWLVMRSGQSCHSLTASFTNHVRLTGTCKPPHGCQLQAFSIIFHTK